MAKTKNTEYVNSLIEFIKDTKPYHCKLSDIVEEYHFYDEFNVRITDSKFTKVKFDAVWPYNFNSSGSVNDNKFLAQRVVSPAFTKFSKNSDIESLGSHKAFRDENYDLANVPAAISEGGITANQTIFAYNKESFDNVGINDAFVERGGDKKTAEPLLEGHDFFQSHGSYTFRIRQTYNANGRFVPLYATTFDDNVVAESTKAIQQHALDVTNPLSAVNIIIGILNGIKNNFTDPIAKIELNKLFTILAIPELPRSYDNFFRTIKERNIFTQEKIDELYLKLSNAAPSLYFNLFSDMGLRNSGELFYDNVKNNTVNIINIKIDPDVAIFEEWILTCVAITEANNFYYNIAGSISGKIGTVIAGDNFEHLKISFSTKIVGTPLVGQTIHIVPRNKLVITKDAPLETWNLIKVNPLAYSRPVFISTRFGHLLNDAGEIGTITILDKTIKNGNYILVAQSAVKFILTKEEDPLYIKTVMVGVPFTDGQISFTIIAGTQQSFLIGDTFILCITNIPASIENLRLGYGYDLDAYDDQTLPYNEPPIPLGFFYDTRYPFFNVDTLGVKVEDYAIDGRKWRMVAIPGPVHITDISTFNYPPGPRPKSLKIYYASGFSVQYSDDDFNSSIVDLTPAGGLQVGALFESTVHGISFVIRAGDKPFIGAISDDPGFAAVRGGDVFSFTVRNPQPELDGGGLNSKNVPRLIMHGDSFHNANESTWIVDMKSPTAYSVHEKNKVTSRNREKQSIDKGMSFNDLDIHFTLVGGRFGLLADEKFVFKTFNKKPSYLVHGSVSGWQPDAEVGTYYSNGKISFKIDTPTPVLYTLVGSPVVVPTYQPLSWMVNKKHVIMSRLRFDTPSISYLLERQCNGYMITRSDVGVIGFSLFDKIFSDQYISIKIPDVQMQSLKIDINGSQFPLWNGHDVLIVRPKAKIKYPTENDFVLIEKTRNGSLNLALTSTTSADAYKLLLCDINDIFIPKLSEEVEILSPENSIRDGWMPIFSTKEDIAGSIAEYSDVTINQIFRSAATNEVVGSLKPSSKNLDEPVLFEWDEDFLLKYLPTNSDVSIITTGTGWSEKISVHLTESIKFLSKFASLPENQIFYDHVNVEINDNPPPAIELPSLIKITSNYNESLDVLINEEKTIHTTNSNEALTESEVEEVTAILNRGEGVGYDSLDYDRGGYDQGALEKITFFTNKYMPIDLSKVDGLTYDEYITDYYIFGLARIIEVIFKEPPPIFPTFNLWLPNELTYTKIRTIDRLSPTTFVFYIANSSLGKIIVS